MSNLPIDPSISDNDLRRKVRETKTRWNISETEIATLSAVPQSSLSKWMRGLMRLGRNRSKLISFLNRLMTTKPPKEARYILREPLLLNQRLTVRDALELFEKNDTSACILKYGQLAKIVTEESITEYLEATSNDRVSMEEAGLGSEPLMITPSKPYGELLRVFRRTGRKQAVLVQDIINGKIQIVGMITDDEVHPAPDLIGNPARRFWERRGGKYVNQMLPGKVAGVLSERILTTFKDKPRKQRVLDFGTGPLNFAVAYSQKASVALPETDVHIVANDHKIKQFEETAKRRRKELGLTDVELDFDGMEHLKFWRDEFDIVAFNMVLPAYSTMIRPSLQVAEEFLKDAIRVLRPRGKMAISYYDRGILDSLNGIIERVFNQHGRYFWRTITQLFSLTELQELLTHEEFRIENSGTEPVEADDIKNGDDLFEFLLCSQIAVDFSFIRCPKAIRDKLRKDICDALDKAFQKPGGFEVSFPINFVVASKG